MPNLNRANFKDERVAQIRKYLRDPSAGDPDEVQQQLNYFKKYKFSINNGKLFAEHEGVRKQILSDSEIEKKVANIYDTKPDHYGRGPTLLAHMRQKYWNVSYKKIQRGLKSSKTYTLYDAR